MTHPGFSSPFITCNLVASGKESSTLPLVFQAGKEFQVTVVAGFRRYVHTETNKMDALSRLATERASTLIDPVCSIVPDMSSVPPRPMPDPGSFRNAEGLVPVMPRCCDSWSPRVTLTGPEFQFQ